MYQISQTTKTLPTERQDCFIEVIYDIINNLVLRSKVLSTNKKFAYGRIIGQTIYELRTTYSGFTSEQALIDRYNLNLPWSDEHMYPRQFAGNALVDYFYNIGSVNLVELKKCLSKFVVVNRTTKLENRRLRKFQDIKVFTDPHKAYSDAGVILRPWEKGKRIITLPEVYPDLIPYLNNPLTPQSPVVDSSANMEDYLGISPNYEQQR